MTEQSKHLIVTPSTARRLTYTEPGHATLESVSLQPPRAGEVMVETRYSALSRGTEALVFKGQVPESEWERMRCPHMAGAFSFPVSYGYASVGKVIARGPDVTTPELDETVFVLHPHQDRYVVPAATCNPLPHALPPRRAVLAPNMETALNAVWDAQAIWPAIKAAKAVVLGAGIVGLLTAHALRSTTDISPPVIDINPERATVVRELGFEFLSLKELSNGNADRFDVLFHASGSPNGLQTAIDLSAFEARIIEMSWYGSTPAELDLGGAFHSQRLHIISSQVGTIAPAQRAHMTHADRLQAAMSLLDCDRLDNLIDDAIEFPQLANHVASILGSRGNGLCPLIRYP